MWAVKDKSPFNVGQCRSKVKFTNFRWNGCQGAGLVGHHCLLICFCCVCFSNCQIFSIKSPCRRRRHTTGAGVCSAAVPVLPPARRCCRASEPYSVRRFALLFSSVWDGRVCRFWNVCFTCVVLPVTPGDGCAAWGRNTGPQQDEEEGERKGSRKKGRSRGCGPHREHSADARWKHFRLETIHL